MRAAALLLLAVAPVLAQDVPPIEPRRVDAAVLRAVDALKKDAKNARPWSHFGQDMRYDELIALALHHGGLPEPDPVFQDLLRTTLTARLSKTYLVSLQAVLLEQLGRVRFQKQLHACGQFLVDNQCKNGQWSYGEPSLAADAILEKAEADEPPPKEGATRPLKRRPVRASRAGPEHGDNSNSQYAALGLRACAAAGIDIPEETWRRARKAWIASQKPDGGWCYQADATHGPHRSYGAMTAGAVAALLIAHKELGEDGTTTAHVKGGLGWLAKHFTAAEHPGPSEIAGLPMHDYFYYLYAIERVGSLLGKDQLGGKDWYQEGARRLLELQKPDGAWTSPANGNFFWDTSFAILFLRRSTRPLIDVATKEGK